MALITSKTWSTMAQYADKCLLLVRTNSDGPKQAGITFLLMDMNAKGVTVRPINQIQGDQEFCEMFLDDVEIPVTDRVGEENAGWAVSQATLSSERGLTLMELTYKMRGALWRIAELIRRNGHEEDKGLLRDFGQLVVRCDTACAIADQFLQNRIDGIERVGDASVVKNTYSRVLREYSLLGTRLGGIDEQYRAPIVYGDLIRVAPDADEEAMEAARKAVEAGLDDVHARAYAKVGGVDPGAGLRSA